MIANLKQHFHKKTRIMTKINHHRLQSYIHIETFWFTAVHFPHPQFKHCVYDDIKSCDCYQS